MLKNKGTDDSALVFGFGFAKVQLQDLRHDALEMVDNCFRALLDLESVRNGISRDLWVDLASDGLDLGCLLGCPHGCTELLKFRQCSLH